MIDILQDGYDLSPKKEMSPEEKEANQEDLGYLLELIRANCANSRVVRRENGIDLRRREIEVEDVIRAGLQGFTDGSVDFKSTSNPEESYIADQARIRLNGVPSGHISHTLYITLQRIFGDKIETVIFPEHIDTRTGVRINYELGQTAIAAHEAGDEDDQTKVGLAPNMFSDQNISQGMCARLTLLFPEQTLPPSSQTTPAIGN
jgi:hypothetical protein